MGALTDGLLVDALEIPVAITIIGGVTFLSGLLVATVIYETLPARQPADAH